MSTVVEPQLTAFDSAWNKAKHIKGWLREDEARLLFKYAHSLAPGSRIVEIGAYCGKSTTLLAESGNQVCTYDPLIVGWCNNNAMQITDDDVTSLRSVVSRYDKVWWTRSGTSRDNANAALLYVDGDHSWPQPLVDFGRAELRDGSIVAFHDMGLEPGVDRTIAELEDEGKVTKIERVASMYVGRVNLPPRKPIATKTRILVAQPYHDKIEHEAYMGSLRATREPGAIQVDAMQPKGSALGNGFNQCLAVCLNRKYDYFAMLHSDIGVEEGWVDRLLYILNEHQFDMVHAVAALKDARGMTSTAIAYSDDPWEIKRRLTTTELVLLPDTFGVEEVRESVDGSAKYLLPNTGCMLVRADSWLKNFPGFEILDRVRRASDGEWVAEFLPEDWNLGLWMGVHGFSVGATTAVKTEHFGRVGYSTSLVWGNAHDPDWERQAK